MADFKPKNKFQKFISGKGFYAVLALCLVGTAAAAWVAVDSTMNNLQMQDQSKIGSSAASSASSSKEENTWSYPAVEDAEKKTSDVLISSSQSSSSSSTQSSSSQQQSGSSASSAASEQQTMSPDLSSLHFVLPIESDISVQYSMGELVKNVTLKEWRTHDGIDIKAPHATTVNAITTGVVSSIYTDPLWGNVIEIEHVGGMMSQYCGLDENIMTAVGTSVEAGDIIGYVGDTPAEMNDESHLHFGMKVDGKWVDPTPYFD